RPDLVHPELDKAVAPASSYDHSDYPRHSRDHMGHKDVRRRLMEKHIDLIEGDTLVVRSVSRTPPKPPPKPDDDLDVLLTIPPVDIYANKEGTYVYFLSDLD